MICGSGSAQRRYTPICWMKKERPFKSRLRRWYRVIELGSACVSRAGEAVSGSRTF